MVCPTCGADNKREARFCSDCGTALRAAQGESRAARKTVTILFVDLVGSTQLGERLEPESLQRLLGRFFRTVQAAVERHGGRAQHFVGDAVIALFGVPAMHEDDALRAVRAAGDVREELERLNDEEIEPRFGVRLVVRAGINTGELVIREPVSDFGVIAGDPVNLAARLEQAAQPGEILLGATTFRLVRDAVVVEPMPPIVARGKSEQVSACRLLRVLPPEAVRKTFSRPLVGRGAELAELVAAYERARDERSCRLHAIVGPAGIGKSRLAAELHDRVAGEAIVLRGRCLPYGEGITYWPVLEIVKAAAGLSEADGPGVATGKLEALLEGVDDAGSVAARVAELAGLAEPGAGQDEGFWGMRRLLEALGRRGPVVVVIDDLHWAEAGLLDLVEHLADRCRGAPILILCLARAERALEERPGLADSRENGSTTLLGPLSDGEVEGLLEGVVGGNGLADAIRERVVATAEGNPLFAEELSAMLAEGELRQPDAGALAMPPTIAALLSARIDGLPAGERAVLETASVVGQVFWLGALTELVPEAVRPHVRACVLKLVEREILRRDAASFAGDEGFSFRHILIQDAAYRSLGKEERAELHVRFADWLERAGGDRAEHEAILGYHLERAHFLRLEIGADSDPAAAARGAQWLTSAGRRAAAQGDVSAACNLLRRALALVPGEEAAQRMDIRLLLANSALAQADLQLAREMAASVLDEAAAASDDHRWAVAALETARVTLATDPAMFATEVHLIKDEVIPKLARAGDDAHIGAAYGYVTLPASWAGHEDVDTLRRALDHARRGGNRQVANYLTSRLAYAISIGPEPAGRGLRQVERLLHETEPGSTGRSLVLSQLARLRALRGDAAGAREAVKASMAILEDLGNMHDLPIVEITLFDIELANGDVGRALPRLRLAYERLIEMGNRLMQSTVGAMLAYALVDRDDDEAWALTRTAAGLTVEGDTITELVIESARARLLARQGDFADAERAARHSVELAASTNWLTVQGDALLDLAEVLLLAGRESEAGQAVEQAVARYEAKENVASVARARRMLAGQARAAGA